MYKSYNNKNNVRDTKKSEINNCIIIIYKLLNIIITFNMVQPVAKLFKHEYKLAVLVGNARMFQ